MIVFGPDTLEATMGAESQDALSHRSAHCFSEMDDNLCDRIIQGDLSAR